YNSSHVWDLVIKDYDSGYLSLVFSGPEENFSYSTAAFSADGTKLTFSALDDGSGNQYVYVGPASEVERLSGYNAGHISGEIQGLAPVLSLDGHKVAFLSQTTGLATGQ